MIEMFIILCSGHPSVLAKKYVGCVCERFAEFWSLGTEIMLMKYKPKIKKKEKNF